MKKLNFLLTAYAAGSVFVAGTAYAGHYEEKLFSPGDSSTFQNSSTLSGNKTAKGVSLQWSIQPIENIKEIVIQASDDGERFIKVASLSSHVQNYVHDWTVSRSSAYYRLEILWKNGASTYTSNVFVSGTVYPASIVLLTNPIAGLVKLKVTNNTPQLFTAEWRNNQGSFIEAQSFKASGGVNNIQLTPPANVTSGTYYLRVVSDDKKVRQLFRVIKQ